MTGSNKMSNNMDNKDEMFPVLMNPEIHLVFNIAPSKNTESSSKWGPVGIRRCAAFLNKHKQTNKLTAQRASM